MVPREAEGPWDAPEGSLSITAAWGGGYRGNCSLLGAGGGSEQGREQSQEGGKEVPVLSPAFPGSEGSLGVYQTAPSPKQCQILQESLETPQV